MSKVQARKLYQYGQKHEQTEREERRQRDMEEKRAAAGTLHPQISRFTASQPIQPEPVAAPKPVEEVKPDEMRAKLKKLKMLFDNGLITQEEYNQKKLKLLSEL